MIDSVLRTLKVLGAFVIVLGPLIVIHEFGHFIVAKLFRIGVPVFSVGLGPRLFGVRRQETDYRLSAIPLGGYVRLAGDEADEHRTGAPEEFLSRPKYQRFMVFMAGPLMNIVLALLLVWLVLWVYGMEEVPESHWMVSEVLENSPAEASGVRPGDRLISIGGQDARDPDTLTDQVQLHPEQVKPLVIEREGERVTLQLQTGSDPKYRLGDPGWVLRRESSAPPRIERMLDGPARRAGLKKGDVIVGADGQRPIPEAELRQLLASSANREVILDVERDGEVVRIPVTPQLRDGRGEIGVYLRASVHRELTAGEAAVRSLWLNVELSKTLFLVLKRLVRGDISLRAFSGPLEIAQVSEQAVRGGLRTLLGFLAFISLQLGILNLMPIPVLDGGHILILGTEALIRRELSDRLKERVMQAGLVFLIAFFGIIIYFDVIKLALSS